MGADVCRRSAAVELAAFIDVANQVWAPDPSNVKPSQSGSPVAGASDSTLHTIDYVFASAGRDSHSPIPELAIFVVDPEAPTELCVTLRN